MRFHHSTRRGRHRVNQHNQRLQAARSGSGSRWSQLGYCRESNIHFNRQLAVEPPPALSNQLASDSTRQRHQHELGEANEAEAKRPHGRQSSLDHQSSSAECSGNNNETDRLTSQQRQARQLDQQLHRLDALSLQQAEEGDLSKQKSETTRTGEQTNVTICSPEPLITQPPKLDLESAREKLVAQVEKHPFWSNKAARRMRLTSLEERRVFVYELISFCERRDLEWRYEPFRGGLVASIPYRRRPFAFQSGSEPGGSVSQPASPTLAGGALSPLPPAAAQWPGTPARRHRLHRGERDAAAASSGPTTDERPTSGGYRSFDGEVSAAGAGDNESTTGAQQSRTGAVRRSLTSARSLYEPVSALERPMPSPELVWSIEAPQRLRPAPFVGQVYSSEFPNSSFVKRCHGCQGRGRIKCNSCYGVGYEVCISCSGRGTTKQGSFGSSLSGGNHLSGAQSRDQSNRNSSHANGADSSEHGGGGGGGGSRGGSSAYKRGHEPGGITQHSSGSGWSSECCHFCHGAGQKRCWVCAGKAYNHCLGCLGSGQLRCFLRLNITWLNHRDESVLNNSDNMIPRERLRLSTGLTLVDEMGDKLRALARSRLDGATGSATTKTTNNEETPSHLHSVSKRLLERHQQNYRQERLIRQRHKVTQIECHVVKYEWKQRRGHFVIYGQERKVYVAKYPFKSICSIM